MLELRFLFQDRITNERRWSVGRFRVEPSYLSGQISELLVEDDAVRLIPRCTVNTVEVANLLRVVLDQPLLVRVTLLRPPAGGRVGLEAPEAE